MDGEATSQTVRVPGELRRMEQSNLRRLRQYRLILAIAAAAIVLSDAFGAAPDWLLAVLLPYCAYSAWVVSQTQRGLMEDELKRAHWFDAACYLTIITFSPDAANGLSLFLLFLVLLASFHRGVECGIRVAVACATAFVAIRVMHAWLAQNAELLTLSLWPSAMLLGGGIVVSRWSNSEFALRRHRAILNDLNSLANPCRGLELALCELAEMLRAYQHAESFIVVIGDGVSGRYLFCRAGAGRTAHSMRIKRINAEVAQSLLGSTPDVDLLFSRPRRFWQRTIAGAYDRVSLKPRPAERAELEQIANLLEADSFVAVAVHTRQRAVGRIYATSRRRRFLRTNVGVLQQVVSHAALVIENIELFDRLATELTMQERHTISRDLHDGTIQSYISLEMAVDALCRKVRRDMPITAADLDQLAKMTSHGVAELRGYVNALREKDVKTGSERVSVAVRREAENCSEFSEFNVRVEAHTDIRLDQPMLHEVRNLVREGLANIRRHTVAKHVMIYLREEDERLILQFVNDDEGNPGKEAGFLPRSLNERATQLGGRVDVELDDRRTSVSVAIPVW
jgi:signal transduction histidine kinase